MRFPAFLPGYFHVYAPFGQVGEQRHGCQCLHSQVFECRCLRSYAIGCRRLQVRYKCPYLQRYGRSCLCNHLQHFRNVLCTVYQHRKVDDVAALGRSEVIPYIAVLVHLERRVFVLPVGCVVPCGRCGFLGRTEADGQQEVHNGYLFDLHNIHIVLFLFKMNAVKG